MLLQNSQIQRGVEIVIRAAGLLVICLTLQGCLTTQDTAPRNLDGYVKCNLAASRRVASQSGDAATLALAARGLCLKEEQRLYQELANEHGEITGHRLLQVYRDGVFEGNTTEVVRARGSRAR
jgi:hypothetical protein